MATYVIGDVHNFLIKLDGILKQISPSYNDNIILLGDLFDRGEAVGFPVDDWLVSALKILENIISSNQIEGFP